MDPAALMAMMNNNYGFGGNGAWWIWIILLFFCWGGFGGNGFGRGASDASRLASELNTDANTNLLMQAINGNKEAISSLSNTLNCDFNSVTAALNNINGGVNQISCDVKLSSCEVINAITSGNAALASKLAECCCNTQRSIDSVNLNLTKMGLDIKPEEKEDPRIKELQNEVSELKNIIKQASQMVPAPMKQMLPQDMQNAMNEASH